jgi:DNA-binding IclR family transcriptional regulator
MWCILAPASQNDGTVKSVERALALLAAVASSDSPPYAKDLAERVGMPLPTAFHLLKTLVGANYLTKESKTYALGDEISRLNAALERSYAPPAQLREALAKLAYTGLV